MQQILNILREENVEDKFLKTTSLNYDVECEYRSGRRVLLGLWLIIQAFPRRTGGKF